MCTSPSGDIIVGFLMHHNSNLKCNMMRPNFPHLCNMLRFKQTKISDLPSLSPHFTLFYHHQTSLLCVQFSIRDLSPDTNQQILYKAQNPALDRLSVSPDLPKKGPQAPITDGHLRHQNVYWQY